MNKETNRVAVRTAAFFGTLVGVLSLVGVASADTTDYTGGIFTTMQTQLTTVIIPAAALLAIVGIVFAVAVKWVGKAAKKG